MLDNLTIFISKLLCLIIGHITLSFEVAFVAYEKYYLQAKLQIFPYGYANITNIQNLLYKYLFHINFHLYLGTTIQHIIKAKPNH